MQQHKADVSLDEIGTLNDREYLSSKGVNSEHSPPYSHGAIRQKCQDKFAWKKCIYRCFGI